MRAYAARVRSRVQRHRATLDNGAQVRFGRSLWSEGRARLRAKAQSRRAGIEIGHRVRFGRGVRIDAPAGSRIVLGDDVQISDFVILEAQTGGVLSLGDSVVLGRGVVIAAQRHVSMGRHSGAAEWSSIRDHDHDPAYPVMSMHVLQEDVRIGDRVAIGARTAVVRGASIGNDSFVGANSVVNKHIPSGCLAAGVPVRILRQGLRDPVT